MSFKLIKQLDKFYECKEIWKIVIEYKWTLIIKYKIISSQGKLWNRKKNYNKDFLFWNVFGGIPMVTITNSRALSGLKWSLELGFAQNCENQGI